MRPRHKLTSRPYANLVVAVVALWICMLYLVLTRQTGSSGEWQYEEYVRRTAAAVLPK